jgi:hypothetical protein
MQICIFTPDVLHFEYHNAPRHASVARGVSWKRPYRTTIMKPRGVVRETSEKRQR